MRIVNVWGMAVMALSLAAGGCDEEESNGPPASAGGEGGAGADVSGAGGSSQGGEGGISTGGADAGAAGPGGSSSGGGGLSSNGSGGSSSGGSGGSSSGSGGSGSTPCQPGETLPCYSGPAGTDGVGVCHAGIQTCEASGMAYGPCMGEQTPLIEICDSMDVDEDCNGVPNDLPGGCACGDGLVGPGEECDLGAENGGVCSTTCREQRILQVEAGDLHVCALLSGGKVKCWGKKEHLGLGDLVDGCVGDEHGEMGADLDVVSLGAGNVAVEIAAGRAHNCARFADGRVKCWGRNEYGQLGLGIPDNQIGLDLNDMGAALPFVQLGVGRTAVSITAGGDHTCALLDNGRVKCWGRNSYGQLGLGNKQHRGDHPNEMGDNLPPVDLGPDVTATAVSAGWDHTCALLSGGEVKCWGLNNLWQLGVVASGSVGDAVGEMGASLKLVSLGADGLNYLKAVQLSAGYRYTCAVTVDGGVVCWGANNTGESGQGPANTIKTVAAVDLGNDGDGVSHQALHVSTSGGNGTHHHTCVLLVGGELKCWGSNYRWQLGLDIPPNQAPGALGDHDGEMGNNLPVVNLGAGQAATGVTVGCSSTGVASHTCALLANGAVKCWGLNYCGVAGFGPTGSTLVGQNGMGDNLPAVKLFSDDW